MEKSEEKTVQSDSLFKKALLVGLICAAGVFLAWFFISRSMKSVGLAIWIAAAVVFVIEILVGTFTRNLKKGIKAVIRIGLILLDVIIFMSATVYSLSQTQLFYPHFDSEAYDELQGYENAEELSFESTNGTVSGWMLHNAQDGAPLVLYYYGNGENASARALRLLTDGSIDVFNGCNVAILDYPSYGKSEGNICDETLRTYALAAYDYVASRADVDDEKIIVFGYSLGTGLANYTASQCNVAGLMLMAPYADGYDLYNGYINIFHGPLRLLVGYKMEAAEYAKSIDVVPLVIASRDDKFVSFATSERLVEAYPQGSDFRILEGISHNEFWGNDEVYSYISEYIGEVMSK